MRTPSRAWSAPPKYGDGFACPPETPKHEVAARYKIVQDGFAARGKEFGPQPLRRNILVADTREEAIAEYARVAKGRYLTYAAEGPRRLHARAAGEGVRRGVAGHAVIGTPDDVVAALVDLVTTLPVDPLMVRPQWPTMDIEETLQTIERLGREIVPALKDIEPIRHIPEESLAAPA